MRTKRAPEKKSQTTKVLVCSWCCSLCGKQFHDVYTDDDLEYFLYAPGAQNTAPKKSNCGKCWSWSDESEPINDERARALR